MLKFVNIGLLCFGLAFVNNSFAKPIKEIPPTYSWSCTASFINDEGYLATAAHCIASKEEHFQGTHWAIIENGKKYEALLVGADYVNDVAILHTDAPQTSHYSITLNVPFGNYYSLYGYPAPQEMGFTLKLSAVDILLKNGNYWLFNGAACGGHSGGPVVNQASQIVGTLDWGFGTPCSTLGGIIRSEYLVKLLLKLNIPFDLVSSQDPITDVGQVQRNKDALERTFLLLGG